MALYLCRKDVKKKIVKDDHGSLEIRIRYPCSEDGAPGIGFRDALKESFFHVSHYITVNRFRIEKLYKKRDHSLYRAAERWYSCIVIVPVGQRLAHRPHWMHLVSSLIITVARWSFSASSTDIP
jgi:hypothetical protein